MSVTDINGDPVVYAGIRLAERDIRRIRTAEFHYGVRVEAAPEDYSEAQRVRADTHIVGRWEEVMARYGVDMSRFARLGPYGHIYYRPSS